MSWLNNIPHEDLTLYIFLMQLLLFIILTIDILLHMKSKHRIQTTLEPLSKIRQKKRSKEKKEWYED